MIYQELEQHRRQAILESRTLKRAIGNTNEYPTFKRTDHTTLICRDGPVDATGSSVIGLGDRNQRNRCKRRGDASDRRCNLVLSFPVSSPHSIDVTPCDPIASSVVSHPLSCSISSSRPLLSYIGHPLSHC